jgi:hypothetical protein
LIEASTHFGKVVLRVSSASTSPSNAGPSQRASASRGRITGMRSCSAASVACAGRAEGRLHASLSPLIMCFSMGGPVAGVGQDAALLPAEYTRSARGVSARERSVGQEGMRCRDSWLRG